MRSVVAGGRRQLYERWATDYNRSPAPEHEARIRRLAPLYLVLYAYVFTLVAFDGIMALQPHWFSNLLGGFFFMGSFLGAHMLLALLMLYGARHLGVSDLVSPKQRHDLGKLCFGFTVFWTYLMWAQFLVIWYGNLPEETGFVFARLWGHWLPIGKAVFLGMFLIPFFGLLGVAPKKTRVTLGFFATVSLVSLWLERYLLVMPSVTPLPGPGVRSGCRSWGRRSSLPACSFCHTPCSPGPSRCSRPAWPRSHSTGSGDTPSPPWSSITRRGRGTMCRPSCWSGGASDFQAEKGTKGVSGEDSA